MAILKRDESAASPGAMGDLLLGAGAEFEGRLTFAGTVRIDARFKGTITTNDVLVVGEHARIDADITCGTIIVHGEVTGTVHARDAVDLRVPAKLHGDVETPSLAIERGAVFEGASRRPGQATAERRDVPSASASAPTLQ
jgi:cytoskeletal protein CcmA (bactofilin family)